MKKLIVWLGLFMLATQLSVLKGGYTNPSARYGAKIMGCPKTEDPDHDRSKCMYDHFRKTPHWKNTRLI